jgi:hypothetical protein
MRSLILLFTLCFAQGAAAEIQFVGVMTNSTQTLFAIRTVDGSPAKWLNIGNTVEGFVIETYNDKSEALTLRKGTGSLVLLLPAARVRMVSDEVVAGLRRILNIQNAAQMRDLLHPKLRALFKEEDLEGRLYADVLAPGAKVEILPLTPEEEQWLGKGLSDLEKFLGVRPNRGLWIKTAKGKSMSFVVSMGESWFLAPSVPGVTLPE